MNVLELIVPMEAYAKTCLVLERVDAYAVQALLVLIVHRLLIHVLWTLHVKMVQIAFLFNLDVINVNVFQDGKDQIVIVILVRFLKNIFILKYTITNKNFDTHFVKMGMKKHE